MNKGLDKLIENNCVKATLMDYCMAIDGFFKKDPKTKFTHYYNYPFESWVFMMATESFMLKGEGFYGANSFNLIVPKGLVFNMEKYGHCDVYDCNYFHTFSSIIPAFVNMDIGIIPDYDLKVSQAREEDRIGHIKFMDKYNRI